jgi:hypothetical protein
VFLVTLFILGSLKGIITGKNWYAGLKKQDVFSTPSCRLIPSPIRITIRPSTFTYSRLRFVHGSIMLVTGTGSLSLKLYFRVLLGFSHHSA